MWQIDGSGTHSWLVLHSFEEQTVLISITHTRSTKRQSVTAQELCHHCSQSDWEIRLSFMLRNSSVPWEDARGTDVIWSCYTYCNVWHIHTNICVLLLTLHCCLTPSQPPCIYPHTCPTLRVSGSQTKAQEQKSAKRNKKTSSIKQQQVIVSLAGHRKQNKDSVGRDDGILKSFEYNSAL